MKILAYQVEPTSPTAVVELLEAAKARILWLAGRLKEALGSFEDAHSEVKVAWLEVCATFNVPPIGQRECVGNDLRDLVRDRLKTPAAHGRRLNQETANWQEDERSYTPEFTARLSLGQAVGAGALSVEQARFLVLDSQGYTDAEIAVKVGLTKSNAIKKRQRAEQQVREWAK